MTAKKNSSKKRSTILQDSTASTAKRIPDKPPTRSANTNYNRGLSSFPMFVRTFFASSQGELMYMANISNSTTYAPKFFREIQRCTLLYLNTLISGHLLTNFSAPLSSGVFRWFPNRFSITPFHPIFCLRTIRGQLLLILQP